MADYAVTHAGALASVAAAGAAVTFTFTTPGTYDVATGTYSGATSTAVAGSAIRVKGDPAVYERLALVEAEAPTLLFCPATYASAPVLGASVTWSSTVYTVRDIAYVAPDGNVILARVVMAR